MGNSQTAILADQDARGATSNANISVVIDEVPLSEWRLVVTKALQDAKDGDAKARDWLAQYLIGESPDLHIMHEFDDSHEQGASVQDVVRALIANPEYQEFARERVARQNGKD